MSKSKTDEFGRIDDDPRVNECFANKKRLHSPQNREAAFAFEFHECVRNLFSFAHVTTDDHRSFKDGLEVLKAQIRAYETTE